MTRRPAPAAAPAINAPVVTVQHFAEAVAARTNALRVYPTQLNDIEERRWADELFRLPVAVYVANAEEFRCLAFDFDSAKGDAGADAADCARLLAESGIRALVCESGPGGGRHVLSTWKPPVASETVHRLADALCRRYRSLDACPLVNPATGCIRPPLSLHRLGGISTPSTDVRQGLAILTEGNDTDALRRLLGAFGLVYLSRGIESALRQGHMGTRYRTPSEARFAVGLAIFNAGGSRTDFIDEIQGSALAYRGDGQQVSVRDLSRDWVRVGEKALKSPRIRSRRDAIARLRAVRVAMHSSPGQWTGRTGATDRRVYFAHLQVAERTGKLAPEVGLREIAELAALGSLSTVMASRKRLMARGLLRRVRTRDRDQAVDVARAQMWEIVQSHVRIVNQPVTPPAGSGMSHTMHVSRLEMGMFHAAHASEAFRWNGGLGASTHRVYDLVSEREAMSAGQVATSLSMTPGNARRHLRRLERHEMVARAGLLWRLTGRSLDDVALELGVAGRARRQRLRHAMERRAFEGHLARCGKVSRAWDGRSAGPEPDVNTTHNGTD
jgi:DNA-binding transcriptional ArsR family regulator